MAADGVRPPRVLRAADGDGPIALGEDDLLIEGDCADVMRRLPKGAFDLVYADPPFNTGRDVVMNRTRATADDEAERTGFGGRGYRVERVGTQRFPDRHEDYALFLRERVELARTMLAPWGTLYLHLDQRESHRAKLMLDEVFGEECFLNEIIWAYDFGGRPKRRWPAKHDTILVYVLDPERYHFDSAEVEREPYMSPGLAGAEKAARGKLPTDVWWHTIVPTSGSERTGYPTQKPLGVLRRIVAASSRPGGWCLDPFCGSGTLGVAAQGLGRRSVMVDERADAVEIATSRLAGAAARAAPKANGPAG